jgi:hypothetical protein
MRLNADLESGCSLVSHPRWKAGKGAVKLVHNEKRGAASLKPPPDAHRLARYAKRPYEAPVCWRYEGSKRLGSQHWHKSYRANFVRPLHNSKYGSKRNLTVTALDLSDGSIPVDAKAEARNTQASSSVGVGHA